jgi:hypothetical protein
MSCVLNPLQADSEVLEQLRSDMEGLIAEVSDLSRRNDELMTSKDSDLVVIRDLDTQLKEYKRKYEQAKTELRSVKGIYTYPFPLLFASYSHPNHSYFGPLPAETQIRRSATGLCRRCDPGRSPHCLLDRH